MTLENIFRHSWCLYAAN